MSLKRILGAFALLLAASVHATTLNPVQLLNPTGSSAGQAPVSTGPTTAPTWGNVPATALAAQAANTVVANATGSSASPTAFAMPSCTGSANALGYTSGTGIVCNSAINAAQLNGATFATPPVAGYGSTTPEPVAATTISATGLISPASTIGIKGTATNDSAQAGSYGEYPAPTNLSSVSLTSGTPANVSSVSLTAGDYDVTGICQLVPAGSTTTSSQSCGISTTSAIFGALGTYVQYSFASPAGAGNTIAAPAVRISLASTTTVFLVINQAFAVSTMTGNGFLRVRRIR